MRFTGTGSKHDVEKKMFNVGGGGINHCLGLEIYGMMLLEWIKWKKIVKEETELK